MSRRLRLLGLALLAGTLGPVAEAQDMARNPILWADVPDPSTIRVGDTYYMTSTTMHMAPGVPVMTSPNLVDWTIAGYAYDTLADTDELALRDGQDAYGGGSWASSIRYHDGLFYVVTFSYTTGRTYLFTTDDVEGGDWTRTEFGAVYHDPALFFDDDGRVYLVYGSTDIRIVELTEDATTVKPGGLNELIIEDAGSIAGSEFYVAGEGAHVYKIDGWYYIFLITWPQGSGRTELVYRSRSLTGPWEGRIALNDDGVAQGGVVQTPEGDWYAMLFRDSGPVGRIPYLVPVEWEDGWPLFGVERSFPPGRVVPETLDIPSDGTGIRGIVGSDEFDDDTLDLVWQWNHNPVDEFWSLTDRPGYLRLTTDRVEESTGSGSFLETRNTLTQRTFGPQSIATAALDVSGMVEGDVAGLGLLQRAFGFISVGLFDGVRRIIYASDYGPLPLADLDGDVDVVHLRVEATFDPSVYARLFYSTDGETWVEVVDAVSSGHWQFNMVYTIPHFMGYRFALFNFATETPGGHVDFDYFRLGGSGFVTASETPAPEVSPFHLGASAPNPTAGTAEITYDLPEPGTVRLDVFDTLGRRVRTLADGPQSAGTHSMTLDTAGLPSGTYLYRLTVDGASQSGLLTVAR